MANRVISFEAHKVMSITSMYPMLGAHYIHEGLNEGGFTGPSIVLPSGNPSVHYIIAQPRNLSSTELAWKRFKAAVKRSGVPFPDIPVNDRYR